jgi:hypothetical protein
MRRSLRTSAFQVIVGIEFETLNGPTDGFETVIPIIARRQIAASA